MRVREEDATHEPLTFRKDADDDDKVLDVQSAYSS